MVAPSPGYSITIRVQTPASFTATSDLAAAVAEAGAAVTALDVAESSHDHMVIDVSANAANTDHVEEIKAAIEKLDDVTVHKVSDRTFLMHLGGKISIEPKVPLRNRDDLSRAYTPGVAGTTCSPSSSTSVMLVRSSLCRTVQTSP